MRRITRICVLACLLLALSPAAASADENPLQKAGDCLGNIPACFTPRLEWMLALPDYGSEAGPQGATAQQRADAVKSANSINHAETFVASLAGSLMLLSITFGFVNIILATQPTAAAVSHCVRSALATVLIASWQWLYHMAVLFGDNLSASILESEDTPSRAGHMMLDSAVLTAGSGVIDLATRGNDVAHSVFKAFLYIGLSLFLGVWFMKLILTVVLTLCFVAMPLVFAGLPVAPRAVAKPIQLFGAAVIIPSIWALLLLVVGAYQTDTIANIWAWNPGGIPAELVRLFVCLILLYMMLVLPWMTVRLVTMGAPALRGGFGTAVVGYAVGHALSSRLTPSARGPHGDRLPRMSVGDRRFVKQMTAADFGNKRALRHLHQDYGGAHDQTKLTTAYSALEPDQRERIRARAFGPNSPEMIRREIASMRRSDPNFDKHRDDLERIGVGAGQMRTAIGDHEHAERRAVEQAERDARDAERDRQRQARDAARAKPPSVTVAQTFGQTMSSQGNLGLSPRARTFYHDVTSASSAKPSPDEVVGAMKALPSDGFEFLKREIDNDHHKGPLAVSRLATQGTTDSSGGRTTGDQYLDNWEGQLRTIATAYPGYLKYGVKTTEQDAAALNAKPSSP